MLSRDDVRKIAAGNFVLMNMNQTFEKDKMQAYIDGALFCHDYQTKGMGALGPNPPDPRINPVIPENLIKEMVENDENTHQHFGVTVRNLGN